ncbi:hypothetical protein SLS56_007463 [Neofusicoccum ribis]|uniref:F-box domain-containing protein n=1 Tax=Neofusicoccum ribis TaxID=45134 RepID=A0ABR3SNQ1_9PEZI
MADYQNRISTLPQNTTTGPTCQTGMDRHSSGPCSGLLVPAELTKMILRLVSQGLSKPQYISVILTCKEFFRLGEEYIYEDISLGTLYELEDFTDRFPGLSRQLGMVKRLTLFDEQSLYGRISHMEREIARDFVTIKLPQLHMLKTVSLKIIQPIFYTGSGWRGIQFVRRALAVLPESVEELELDTTHDEIPGFPSEHPEHFCTNIPRILPRLVRFSWSAREICPAAFGITSDPSDGPDADGALPPHPFPKLKELHLDVTYIRCNQHHRCDPRLPQPIPYPTWTIESISQALVPRLRAAIAAGRFFPRLEHAMLVRRITALSTHARRDSGWLLALDLLGPASLSVPYAVTRTPSLERSRRHSLALTDRDGADAVLRLAPYDLLARGSRDPDLEAFVREFDLRSLVGGAGGQGDAQEMLRDNVRAEERIAMFDERARRWEGALLEMDQHYGFMMAGWRAAVVGDEVDLGEDARLVWVGLTDWI